MLLDAPEVIVDDNHVYSEGDKTCPRSATGLLKRYGLTMDFSKIPAHVLDKARQRGIAIAVGSKLIAMGDELVESTIDPRIAAYLVAFQKFWNESGVKLIETEVPHISPLGYGFTPDLVCWIGGRRAVVDGKATFKIPKSVGPQTAAYKIGLNTLYPKLPIEDRYALWLKPDATYKLSPLQDPDDETAFMDCLEADIKFEKWRQKYGGSK